MEKLKQTYKELEAHVPFTIFGAITGILIMFLFKNIPFRFSCNIFCVFHPIHVVLSALVTVSMYELHKCKRISSKR